MFVLYCVILFIVLYKFLCEIVEFDYLNESCWLVFLCSVVSIFVICNLGFFLECIYYMRKRGCL